MGRASAFRGFMRFLGVAPFGGCCGGVGVGLCWGLGGFGGGVRWGGVRGKPQQGGGGWWSQTTPPQKPLYPPFWGCVEKSFRGLFFWGGGGGGGDLEAPFDCVGVGFPHAPLPPGPSFSLSPNGHFSSSKPRGVVDLRVDLVA